MISKLRLERLKAGLKISDLRDLTSISTSRLSFYERGAMVPPKAKIAISKALGKAIGELFDENP